MKNADRFFEKKSILKMSGDHNTNTKGGEDQEGAYQRFLTPNSVPFDPLELADGGHNNQKGAGGTGKKIYWDLFGSGIRRHSHRLCCGVLFALCLLLGQLVKGFSRKIRQILLT